jgi:ferrous iron transport protein B
VPGSRYELSLSPAQALTAGERARRFVHDLLVGEFGLVSMALCYALAVVLPIVGTFFLAFGVLEDSGYLARLAILVHRVFRAVGLDGRAVVPMLLGLGCGTMATLATRILRTRRERIVATLLLALAVPCSAQLGVLLAMATRVSAAAVLLWVAVMTGVFLSVGALASRLWRGERSELILELPPMRRPRLADVAGKAATRVRWYLAEIIPLFAIGALALFGLDRLGLLRRIASAAEPLVTGWLGLPAEAANALLVGFLRRDFGAVYLLEAATGPRPVLGPHEVLVAMVTITLFMPCVAMMLMIAREHGRRVAAATTAFVFAFAFLIGGLVHRLALGLGL